ncbi:MAG: Asp-tRNA(Asn)/Glu-tRNA(Gln) amidotransferase subunit GatC [Candidatus Diapherotrites archaeon]
MAKPKIDRELLEAVARNARLKLSEKEIAVFLPQLQEVLHAFSKLDELDVKKEKPSFQPIPMKNVLRKDTVSKCFSQEEALSLTKLKKDGYFKGPKVL